MKFYHSWRHYTNIHRICSQSQIALFYKIWIFFQIFMLENDIFVTQSQNLSLSSDKRLHQCTYTRTHVYSCVSMTRFERIRRTLLNWENKRSEWVHRSWEKGMSNSLKKSNSSKEIWTHGVFSVVCFDC